MLASTAAALAQMKSGDQMKNYAEVFGLNPKPRTAPFDITLLESKPDGNVLFPGEQPQFTFLIKNNQSQPIKTTAKFDVLSYGTQGIPGDIWLPDLVKFKDLPPVPIELDIPAGSSQIVTVKAELPEAFGAYALIADLGDLGRAFGTTCVRTFQASPEKRQFPTLSLDDMVGAPVLGRLGIQAVRISFGYAPTDSKEWKEQLAKLDKELKEFQEHNITVLLMFLNGSGPDAQPLGRTRPHLTKDGVMEDTKQDHVWLPKYDSDFRSAVAQICKKYGWPRGPITAVELWNEPWEGISISGWGADMLRFRELYTAMAEGVEEARKDGVDVLIAGCDSSTNTWDKLFPDGKDTFLKWLDVCAIHYQGPSAPSVFRDWINRDHPNGRVKIWDTESWVANTDDRVATVIAANRAFGYDRAMGIYGGNVSRPIKKKVRLPDGSEKEVHAFDAWSTAAAVGAASHFLGERPFRELLFKNGLPWVMVFDGLEGNPDDGTLVITGDLGESFERNIFPFRGIRSRAEVKQREDLRKELEGLKADSPRARDIIKDLSASNPLRDVSLTLDNAQDEFQLFDFYGNPVASEGGTITVPLDGRGFFLRAKGKDGSFDRLIKAVGQARIEGYEPVSIIARDFLAPPQGGAPLRLSLTNILNRPVTGQLEVTLDGSALAIPDALTLQPNETREVEVKVPAGTAASPENTYSVQVRFDAGQDGFSIMRENLHVNQIAKRKVSVDGRLDDWKGALPLPVQASTNDGPTLMEAAWLPFIKHAEGSTSGRAKGYLAYDNEAFYFAAEILDDSPHAGTLRFETRDEDADFYPEISYEMNPETTMLKKEETWSSGLREKAALFLPDSDTKRSFTAWTSVVKAMAFDLQLPADKPQLLSLYFVDWDGHQHGRRRVNIEIQNPQTGKKLATATVKEYGHGTYAQFAVQGDVRVILRSPTWLNASLSGIFLDPAPEGIEVKEAPFAKYIGEDLETAAAWKGKYGANGYFIAGAPSQLPSGVTITFSEAEDKIEHRWPEGVRRYSYRQRPALPFGTAPKFDNVQIAFNVIPSDEKPQSIPFPPGTMPRFIPVPDTDYEYALNQVSEDYGGGTEIWRSQAPEMPRKHFYPRQPASPYDGPVKDGKLTIKHADGGRIVEAAIPWSEIPLVKKALDAGDTIKFTFRVNDDKGNAMDLAEDRSVSQKNPYTFHPDWISSWSNDLEFSFEK